jgi:hypothetical protein
VGPPVVAPLPTPPEEVANFSNFDATYGSLAGAIVFLVWLWLTNTAVLLGAELNAEIEGPASCRPVW